MNALEWRNVDRHTYRAMTSAYRGWWIAREVRGTRKPWRVFHETDSGIPVTERFSTLREAQEWAQAQTDRGMVA